MGLGLWLGSGSAAGEPVHQDLAVVLHPQTGDLAVEATITVPKARAPHKGTYAFTLQKGWNPLTTDRGVVISRVNTPSAVHSESYSVSVPSGQRTFSLSYRGRVNQASESSEDGGHGDALTPDAVVLSRESLWYPILGDDLVTFTLRVLAPAGWEVISQGKRTLHRRNGDSVEVRWESPEPQDDIYLVGGALTEYTRQAGETMAMAFLRDPDSELADAYLDATDRYVRMYSALFGAYPYPKFAMVENAWETGYGMPSFTLLGSTVIRLPFILHSSYPHEILHNWWGNGVFVEAGRGNWAEGLTAYLADHLLAEQRGAGAEYRRAALQQYADYVTHGRDFPLSRFTARDSRATQAVGYGKALMVFHMARLELGDDAFLGALRGFFTRHRFRRATFTDLDRAFAHAAGRVSGPLAQWTERTGAPELTVSHVKTSPRGAGYLLTALVEQRQPGAEYRLRVPAAITLEGRADAYQSSFTLDRKRVAVEWVVPGRPLRLDIDPEFDVFRRLNRAEVPPALSQLFGAKRVLVILPAAAPTALLDGYRGLAESLGRISGSHDVAMDAALDHLPRDRAIWVLGWENRFRSAITDATGGLPLVIGDRSATIQGTELTREHHALVVTGRQSHDPELGIGWVACDRDEALPGLARKLPHYGKYGYAGFKGIESTNIIKGEWRVLQSPLSIPVTQPDGRRMEVPSARLAPRRALEHFPESDEQVEKNRP